MPNTKIATCCYCGTRAALILRVKERHELACSKCGAPLRDLKMLRLDFQGERELVRPSRVRSHHRNRKKYKGDRPARRKKQKSLAQRFMEEAWDVAEDVFDIFD